MPYTCERDRAGGVMLFSSRLTNLSLTHQRGDTEGLARPVVGPER